MRQFTLLVLFSLSFQPLDAQFIAALNTENVEDIVNKIDVRYSVNYGPHVTRNDILLYLQDLVDVKPTSSVECQPGGDIKCTSCPIGPEEIMILRWNQLFFEADSSFGSYFDLDNGWIDAYLTTMPGLMFTHISDFKFKIFAFNGRCADIQSDYLIIIIDKDIDFNSLTSAVESLSMDTIRYYGTMYLEIDDLEVELAEETTELSTVADITMSVSPNPTHQDVNVQYQLGNDSALQLDILEPMTGKTVQSLLQLAHQAPGQYEYHITLSDLPKGMYLLRLRTETQTIIRKIIKM